MMLYTVCPNQFSIGTVGTWVIMGLLLQLIHDAIWQLVSSQSTFEINECGVHELLLHDESGVKSADYFYRTFHTSK